MQPEPEGARQLAYGSNARPMETGLALLAAWLREYSKVNPGVVVLNPFSDQRDSVVRDAAHADLIGFTTLYSNYPVAIELAALAKSVSPEIKTVLGGPDAALKGALILKNNPSIDFVVGCPQVVDGEESLLGLVDGWPAEKIPNLYYRDGNEVRFTFPKFADLRRTPLWNYEDFLDIDSRLAPYRKKQPDHWAAPQHAVFSMRGCPKAVHGGACSFCTSSIGNRCTVLPAEKFWRQTLLLQNKYGLEDFYIGDNIFAIPRWLEILAAAKPGEAKAQFRAYAYMPYLARLSESDLIRVVENSRRIGVYNYFFGTESFSEFVLSLNNKEYTPVEECIRVSRALYEVGGIRSTYALIVGLWGESPKSLAENLSAQRKLQEALGGIIERWYLSYYQPLLGSATFSDPVRGPMSFEWSYYCETRKHLYEDDNPNLRLLRRLAIKHFTSITFDEAAGAMWNMVALARSYLPPYCAGGFELEL